MKRALLVSSSGGHWKQLMLLSPAFTELSLNYASTSDCPPNITEDNFTQLPEASRWNKWGLVKLAFAALFIITRVRPDVVVSTGAAPGLLCIVFGKLLGAQTIWIDSIANGEQMSMSGKLSRRFADVWLTQWPELATENGPEFRGSVL
jgi:UDP-N-acetylglucosamine:LPS N-acetylglucosamine transferase